MSLITSIKDLAVLISHGLICMLIDTLHTVNAFQTHVNAHVEIHEK